MSHYTYSSSPNQLQRRHTATLSAAGFPQIAFVLDQSESMGSVREKTIEGFNKLLTEQKQLGGRSRVQLNSI
jgi:hypothetical protein